MGMLDSHPLNLGIKIKEPCENKVPGNKIYLGIIFKKLNQTWECCIPMTIFPGIFFKTLKQTHPKRLEFVRCNNGLSFRYTKKVVDL